MIAFMIETEVLEMHGLNRETGFSVHKDVQIVIESITG